MASVRSATTAAAATAAASARVKLVRKSIVRGYAQSAKQRSVRRNALKQGSKKEGKFSFSWRVEFKTAHILVGKNNLNCLLLFSIYTSACCLTILNYNTEKKIIVLKNTWYLMKETYS